MLTKQEKIRYSRQLMLPGFGNTAQVALKNARVLIIGAGGLGCSVLSALVSGGVGTIGVIDNDKVELHNLHRQHLYTEADVGKNKAFAAMQRLNQMNSMVNINVFEERYDFTNSREITSRFDIVADCSDNLNTRFLVNDCCVSLGIPFVFTAIYQFHGQLAVLNYNNGPTLRDFFPDEAAQPDCAAAGVIGTLPGLMGMMQANEVIKVVTKSGDVRSGKMLIVDLLKNSFFEISAQRK